MHQSVHPSVRTSTLTNMNISKTREPIAIKLNQKHHWGGGKAALGFGSDRLRTLVSLATDRSHRVTSRENLVSTLGSSFFIGSSSFLQVTRTTIKILDELEIWVDSTTYP